MRRIIALLIMTGIIFIPYVSAGERSEHNRPPIIITDPDNPNSVRGTASIAIVWGRTVKSPRNDHKSVLPNLIEAVREYTDITMTGHARLPITSPLLGTTPLAILMTDERFSLTVQEMNALKAYIDDGGFLFCENTLGTVRNSPVEQSFRKLIKDLYGDDAVFSHVENDHPLFHSFFDFSNGFPVNRRGTVVNASPLTAVMIGEKCIALYSNRGIAASWNKSSGNILELKIGVNMLIFVLNRIESMAVKH